MTTYKPCCECNNLFKFNKSQNNIFCNLSCSTKSKNKSTRLKNIQKYISAPTSCLQCKTIVDYNNRKNKFCNHSCAATYNNSLREGRSERSRSKTSISMQGKNTRKFCKISWCIICNTLIKDKHLLTCSAKCKNIRLRQKMQEYISTNPVHKFNRNPHKQSYMEKSFEQWLISHGMLHSLHGYLYEITFYNPGTKKYGRADYVFPKQKIIIELDGTHHLKSDRILLDKIRDLYLTSRGWNVIRISQKEYKNKTKENLLIDLLFK